jgi:hypothetical protein
MAIRKKKAPPKEVVTEPVSAPEQVCCIPVQRDALYAFLTWLSVSPNRVYSIGGAAENQRAFAALSRFCEENNLPALSEDWEDKFKYPTHFI